MSLAHLHARAVSEFALACMRGVATALAQFGMKHAAEVGPWPIHNGACLAHLWGFRPRWTPQDGDEVAKELQARRINGYPHGTGGVSFRGHSSTAAQVWASEGQMATCEGAH